MRSYNKKLKYILNYDNIEIGDIILESGKKPHSLAIQKYTKSDYSHAMICVKKNSLVHAEKSGIFSLNPQRIMVENSKDFKVLRLETGLSEDKKKHIEEFLRLQIGSLYSVKDALMVVTNKNSESTNKHQFCSRLVAQAYSSIGYKIVDSVDFCSPGDIERSSYLVEITNMVREVNEEDIEFYKTRNMVHENQISFYNWVNKTRDLAAQYGYEISVVNDVDFFLMEFPIEDNQVSKWIIESGYMDNYIIEIENNQHMHDDRIFLEKYGDTDGLLEYALIKEYSNIFNYLDRQVQNYNNSQQNYKDTGLKYYSLHINLYKQLLSVSLSRCLTLYSVAMGLIQNKSKNHEIFKVFYGSKCIIDSLINLGIEKYDISLNNTNRYSSEK